MNNISFDSTLREKFTYQDPSFPFVVWTGKISSMSNGIIECHWHNEFEYFMLLSGELEFFIDGQTISMHQGDVAFVNANALHMAKRSGEGKDAIIATISFLPFLFTGGANGTLLKKYFQPILQSTCRGFRVESNELNGSVIIMLLREIYEIKQSTHKDNELIYLSLVSKLWSETLQYIDNHSDIILSFDVEQRYEQKTKEIVSFLHKHYSENIRIEDIIQHAYISRSELFRSFQHYMNQTPIEYLLEYRLAQAVNLLLKTNQSVTQIATDCGFSSVSYFGKAFKNKYGTSPLKFRNRK